MIGVDPSSEGLRAAPRDAGPRGHRTRASTGCSSRTSCPTWSSRRPSAYVHREYAPALRGGRHPGGRPDAGRGRAGRDPAGQRRRARRRDERQHDHLRRPGDDPDGRRGLAGRPRCRTPRSSPRSPRCRAGPGTRAEHRRVHPHHRRAASRRSAAPSSGKAIIILNPAEPPMIMRDTIFCAVAAGRRPRRDRRSRCIAMVTAVQEYVPGYRLLQEPQFDDPSPATQRPDQGQRLRRGRGRRRLPAAVRRQPRHHDRRRHAGRREHRPPGASRDRPQRARPAPGRAPTAPSPGATSTSG